MSTMRKHPLRRIVLSIVSTVSGVVVLLALKPHAPPPTSVQTAAPAESVTAAPSSPQVSPSVPAPESSSASPTASKSKTLKAPSSTPTRKPSPTRAQTQPKPQPTSEPVTTRTVTGGTVETKYGPVQVRITLSGGRITAASAVQSPSSAPRSQELSETAIPQLNQRTIAAQGADIDTVSGATYTSQGYITSLQSALDKAGA